MIYTVRITSKWQMHIPVAIRQALKLTKPSQAEVFTRENEIVVKPKESKILQMAGSLKGITPTKSINLTKICDHIDYSDW